MKAVINTLLKLLGILLLIAGVLKGWQLITGPVISHNPGRLADVKEWFVTTPAVALLTNSKVTSAWEGQAPDFETILQNLTKMHKDRRKHTSLINKSMNTFAIIERRWSL
jgi:hypothetical protein